MFDVRLAVAERYAAWLAGAGTERGLIGPREVPRLWERHVLNSAVLGEAVPQAAHVVDVGSGAGLPGIPLAIARPDLRVVLLEPLLRRTRFLEEVVADLGLADRVSVVRGRAEEVVSTRRADSLAGSFDVVTSRAVAPLDRLVPWSLPLARPGGSVLALKGSAAADELAQWLPGARRSGVVDAEVVEVGTGVVEPAVRLVRLVRRPGA